MTLPGYTAEASLHASARSYRSASSGPTHTANQIIPAMTLEFMVPYCDKNGQCGVYIFFVDIPD